MCGPQAVLFLRAAGTILSIAQSTREARAAQQQANRRNEIAAQARREKENAENLRLRQIREAKLAKVEELTEGAKEARATARTAAETVGGAALDRVINNFFRTEGKYKSTIERNLEAEAANSDTNKRLFAIEQEGRQVYIPEVNTAGIFSAGAISFGGDWLEYQAKKEAKELAQKRHDEMIKAMTYG